MLSVWFCLHVYVYMCMSSCPCLHDSGIPQKKMELTENRTSIVGKKRNTETSNFHWFAANGKRKFVFLGRQTINSNRPLLLQQTCPSMGINNRYCPRWLYLLSFLSVMIMLFNILMSDLIYHKDFLLISKRHLIRNMSTIFPYTHQH